MKIQSNEKGGKIIWDSEDWTHGLAPNWITTGGISVVRGGNRMSSMVGINPFRRWGCALPGFRPSTVTNDSVITAYLRKGLTNGQYAYIVSNGARIHKYDITSSAMINAGVFPYTITPTGGTTPVANDCAIYSAKTLGTTVSGLRYFYTYSSTTIWDVGMFNLNATFDDDFMTSVAVTTPLTTPYTTDGAGYPHPLIVGDDDILYIADRNFVHAYDGYVSSGATLGTFYTEVLTLPAGWIITSMEKTDAGLMFFAYFNNQTFGGTDDYKGQARAWDWKYGELDITRSYDLNDNLTSESFNLGGGVLGIFTYGRQTDPANLGKNSKIQLFDGTKFSPLLGFTGSLPCRGGVEITADCISWNAGGTIYTYGSKLLGESMKDTGLNRIGFGSGQTSGMLSTFWDSLNSLMMSSGTTSSGGLETFRTNYQEGTSLNTALAEPFFPLYSKGRVKNVTIVFSNSISSVLNTTDFTLDLYDENGNTQQLLTQYVDVTDNTKMIKQIKETAGASPVPLMAFEAISLHCLWGKVSSGTATESFGIKRVELDYEIINTNN